MIMSINNTRELKEFREKFNAFKDKKIVLYGIGRYASLIATEIEGFRFVGFMDKNIENIGKTYLNLPILSKEEAESIADLIIIATAEDYWDVIYQRIKDFKLPIYFSNGKKAIKTSLSTNVGERYKLIKSELLQLIEQVDVVSFDFFDTLFVRNVAEPANVFEILELRSGEKDIISLRNRALRELDGYYTFDQLYEKMREISKFTLKRIEQIKELEVEIEKELLSPRDEIFELFQILQDKKEVYIVSEMYLPKEFYISVLELYGIKIPKGRILISNECRASKADGTLYEKLKECNKNKVILHIGDNKKLDVDVPQQYGIKTYHIPSVWELCSKSSIGDVNSYVTDLYSSSILGLQLKRMFSNPYRYKGVVEISTNEEMGYFIYGPVMLTFLFWLHTRIKKDNIKKLIFLARDGFFLEKNYRLLCQLLGEEVSIEYLGISRKLSIMASLTNNKELIDYINMPYVGSTIERIEDRLGFIQERKEPIKSIEDYIQESKDVIWSNLDRIRSNYIAYLKKFQLDNDCAIVDLGTEGTCQRYLNKLLNLRMSGYYFRSNLSKDNHNLQFQKMTPCFQKKEDERAEKSYISKKILFIEAFLTAPYGMIKEIDENGFFICSEKKQNQIYFSAREDMNKGVENFIKDYISYFGTLNLNVNIDFIDQYYGIMLSDRVNIDDSIKNVFFHDNELMGRNESTLFY